MPPKELEARKGKINLFALYVSVVSLFILCIAGIGFLGIMVYLIQWLFKIFANV